MKRSLVIVILLLSHGICFGAGYYASNAQCSDAEFSFSYAEEPTQVNVEENQEKTSVPTEAMENKQEVVTETEAGTEVETETTENSETSSKETNTPAVMPSFPKLPVSSGGADTVITPPENGSDGEL